MPASKTLHSFFQLYANLTDQNRPIKGTANRAVTATMNAKYTLNHIVQELSEKNKGDEYIFSEFIIYLYIYQGSFAGLAYPNTLYRLCVVLE